MLIRQNKLFSSLYVPVSYTHLDVYKRQQLRFVTKLYRVFIIGHLVSLLPAETQYFPFLA